uniref:Uncharacterized protein n=1 Tax=Anguilla anguilla TaxID=7936 RepID=A0A0E9TV47_ANGAN
MYIYKEHGIRSFVCIVYFTGKLSLLNY